MSDHNTDEWVRMYREQVELACDALRLCGAFANAIGSPDKEQAALAKYWALVEQLNSRCQEKVSSGE